MQCWQKFTHIRVQIFSEIIRTIMPRIILFKFVIFLSMQLNLLSLIEAEEDVLQFTLIDENSDRIVLNWEKTEQLLINKNTPLWLARHGPTPGTPSLLYQPDFFSTNVGDFVMYRDVSQSSAAVYFKLLSSLNGNIGTKYSFLDLPLTELGQEHSLSGSAYVTKYLDLPERRRTEKPGCKPINENQADEQPDDNQVTVLYPEILLLVTNDVYQPVKQTHPLVALTYLMMKYITYFNTISMLFDKLSTERVKIHINIAGIIIEDEPGVFPFTRFSEDAPNQINSRNALLYYLPQYLKKLQFSDDAFDFFFVSTGYSLQKSVTDNGYSTPIFHIYELRNPQRSSNFPRFLGSLVKYDDNYAGFMVAAHRIAWLMGIDTKMLSANVEWREKNVQELKTYARKHRNRCFLLNFPRSLQPYGHRIETIAPSRQCICYGYTPATTELDSVGPAGCNVKLMCRHQSIAGQYHGDESSPKNTPLPIEGTPCDTNKVCWQKQCQNV